MVRRLLRLSYMIIIKLACVTGHDDSFILDINIDLKLICMSELSSQ